MNLGASEKNEEIANKYKREVNVSLEMTSFWKLKTFSEYVSEEEAAHKYDVDYVFSSPMRRCLATTYSLFKNHPSKPKIIVLPFLREEFQSSCDVGCKILESKALFPTFDFSFLD